MNYRFSHIDRPDLQTSQALPRVWCVHTRVEITGTVEGFVNGWEIAPQPIRKTGRAVYHSQKASLGRSGKLQRSEAYRANDYARLTGQAKTWEAAERRTTQREGRKAKRAARRLK